MEYTFDSFSRRQDIEKFLKMIATKHEDIIKIKMLKDFFSTPEVIAPMAGIIEILKVAGYEIEIDYNGNALRTSGLENPLTVDHNKYELLSPMYKVWKYHSAEEVSKIVSAYVKCLNEKAVCARGVIDAFEWTVNEVMDNVLQHSKSQFGYIACTATNNQHISVAVYDNGIGILKSFQGSQYRFKTSEDAIVAAMKEGTTRDKNIGQGNGLWGMSKLVANNKGLLNISSDGAIIAIDNNNNLTKHKMHMITLLKLKQRIPGTLVDFQFQCNNEIDFSEVFGKEYQYSNLYLESLEDDANRINVHVNDFSFGYATRTAGEQARNKVMNIITQTEENQAILIDFSGTGIIASSFADEFIGKLVGKLGFIQFNNLIRVINVSKENVAIINRSVRQRLSME